MAERVVIHVGCPKTGTSWIQHQLVNNRQALKQQGFLYPESVDGFEQHFAATEDLRGEPIEEEGPAGPGAWERLADEANAWWGTPIISHELLASCTPEQVARAVAAFKGTDVHVVVTARDLARQIPSEWQEHVKHGFSEPLSEFIAAIRDPERPQQFARWFWAVQDLPHVAMRWATGVGAENVTIVTVPPAGDDASLDQRFGEAIGLDVTMLNREDDRRNTSMGVAEAELLRRLNEQGFEGMRDGVYHAFIRERLVREVLGPQRISASIKVGPEANDWIQEVAAYWLSEIPAAGYRVIGDLQDLVPAPAEEADIAPVREEQISQAAVRALIEAAEMVADLREEIVELQERLASAPPDSAADHVKQQVLQRLEQSGRGQSVMQAFRKLPRRDS